MSQAASAYIRRNLDEVSKLPPPGEHWVYREVDIGKSVFQKLKQYGLIQKQAWTEIGHTEVAVWETKPAAWKKIQAYSS